MEIRVENGTVHVTGDMMFSTVGRMSDGLDSALSPGTPLEVDLAQVGQCDSAALALLLEWGRRANQRGTHIVVCHLPEQLRELADAHDLPPLETVFATCVADDEPAGDVPAQETQAERGGVA